MKKTGTTDSLTPSGKKLMLQLAALESKPLVKIGILGRDFDRPKQDGEGKDTTGSLGVVAASNEFGTDTIPERSYIGSTVDAHAKGDWHRNAERLRKEIVEGKLTTDRALGQQGLLIQRDIQEKLRSDVPPPDKPETIARKGSDKTLIDHAQLVNSIAYEVLRESEK